VDGDTARSVTAFGARSPAAFFAKERRCQFRSSLKLYGDLSASAVRELARAAHRQGMQVWAHAVLFPARASDLVRAGVDVLSHAPFLVWEAVDPLPPYAEAGLRSAPFTRVAPEDPAVTRVLELMASRQVILDATLFLYRAQGQASDTAREDFRAPRLAYAAAADWAGAVTRRARELGVLVSAGTDAMGGDADGELPNFHRELELLVKEAGFTPAQAIAAATSIAARALGIEKTVGTISPGAQADLVILRANPLVDIRKTREIELVVKRGRVLRPR
jgi:imidazolonepropionase-like amidohydrolase